MSNYVQAEYARDSDREMGYKSSGHRASSEEHQTMTSRQSGGSTSWR